MKIMKNGIEMAVQNTKNRGILQGKKRRDTWAPTLVARNLENIVAFN